MVKKEKSAIYEKVQSEDAAMLKKVKDDYLDLTMKHTELKKTNFNLKNLTLEQEL